MDATQIQQMGADMSAQLTALLAAQFTTVAQAFADLETRATTAEADAAALTTQLATVTAERDTLASQLAALPDAATIQANADAEAQETTLLEQATGTTPSATTPTTTDSTGATA